MRRSILVVLVVMATIACLAQTVTLAVQPLGAGGGRAKPADVAPPPPPGVGAGDPTAPPPAPPRPQLAPDDLARPGAPGPVPSAAAALAVPPPQLGRAIAQRLQLSEEKGKKLQEILDKAPERLRPLRRSCADAVDALRTALFAPEKDGPSLRQLMDRANEAEAEVSRDELSLCNEIRALLSAEQLRELGEMLLKPGRRVGPFEPPEGVPPGPRGPNPR